MPLQFFIERFLMSAAVVALLLPVFISLALLFNVLDVPSDRKVHRFPVPLLGGIPIFLSILLVVLCQGKVSPQMLAMLLGSGIILLFGTIDDIRPLSSLTRLIGQLMASFLVIAQGLRISFLPETPAGEVLSVGLTIIWILGVINAVNFADGLDGLSAGMSLIASVFFFVVAFTLKQFDVCLAVTVLAGACSGFIFYNFKPAKVYLGDGGSTLLGFWLACIALYGGWSEKSFIEALGIPILILGVLIFDMIYITLSRIKNGHVRNVRQWLDYTGKDHLHHRLMHMGFGDVQAVIFIYIICIILGLNVLCLADMANHWRILVMMAQAVLIFINITLLMLAGRQLVDPVSHKKGA